MTERVDRASLLREELVRLEHALAELPAGGGGDPLADMSVLFSHMDRARLSEDVERVRAELSEIDVGALRLRLTGKPVHGSAIEADALGDLVRDLDQVGRTIGGDLFIGVPSPGSHVVEVLPAPQRPMFDEPFVATAHLLVDTFDLALQPSVDTQIVEFVAERDPDSMTALTKLVEHLVDHGANVDLTADAGGTRRHRRLDREHAGALLRSLKDVSEATTTRPVEGRFGGALQGSGRFEIVTPERTLRGSVPKAVRSQLVGLVIGDDVTAEIDEIASRRATGAQSKRLRLRSIRPTNQPGGESGGDAPSS